MVKKSIKIYIKCFLNLINLLGSECLGEQKGLIKSVIA